MTIIKINIVVVLYNKSLSESDSLKSLIRQVYNKDKINVFLEINDNSEVPMLSPSELDILSSFFSLKYNHRPENMPLKDIYQNFFDFVKDDDFILLLDDDTNLPISYLSQFSNTVTNYSNKFDVYVPRVTVKHKLYSPYKSFFVFSKPIDLSIKGEYRGLTAINSGVFIKRTKHFNIFSYPNFALFYGTDTVLFDFINQHSLRIFILDISLEHDLSFNPINDPQKYLNSLSKVIVFWQAYFSDSCLKKHTFHIYLILLSIKLSIKYKYVVNLFRFLK